MIFPSSVKAIEMTTFSKNIFLLISAMAIVIVCQCDKSEAQTWSGLSTADNNWSTNENWVGNVAPVPGASLILFDDPSAQFESNQDATFFNAQNLSFDTTNGDFVLGGLNTAVDQLTVSGGGLVSAALDIQSFMVAISDGSTLETTGLLENSSFDVSGDGLLVLTAAGIRAPDSFSTGAGITTVYDTPNLTLSPFSIFAEGLSIIESNSFLSLTGNMEGAGDLVVRGELELASFATISKNVTVEDQGRLLGEGTFEGAMQISGLLDPGNSAGTFEVDGDVDLFDTTVVCIELGGSMEDDSDLISSLGDDNTISLDGTLEVSFLNGFVPDESDEFFFIRGFDVVGQFSNTNGNNGPDQLLFGASSDVDFGVLETPEGTFQIEYGNDFVRLFGFAQSVPEPGTGTLLTVLLLGIFVRRHKRTIRCGRSH